MTLQGKIKIFRDVWYDLTQMSNIFLFSQLSDKHRINYDNWEEDEFLVHSNDGIVKFNQTNEGIYAFIPSNTYMNIVAAEMIMKPPPRT